VSSRFLPFLAALAIALVAAPAAARSPVPIVEFKDQAIPQKDGKAPTDAQVRAAVERAARSLNWTLAPAGEDKLLATLVVRNKHTIAVNLTWTPDKLSATYASSVNMKYEMTSKGPVIHPFYNDWVRTFVEAIQMEILKG
jgi:hypothetical protein